MRCAIIYPPTNLGINAPPGDALAVLIWEIGRRIGHTDGVTVFGNRRRGQAGKESLGGIELRRLAVWPDQLLGQLHRLDGILFMDPKRPFRSSRLYYHFYGKRVALAAHPSISFMCMPFPIFSPACGRAHRVPRLFFMPTITAWRAMKFQ